MDRSFKCQFKSDDRGHDDEDGDDDDDDICIMMKCICVCLSVCHEKSTRVMKNEYSPKLF